MYHTIAIGFGHFQRAPGWMSFLLKCASAKPQGFSLFFFFYIDIYIFQQPQACVGSIQESKLKSKISHSLIHMGFIRLVTWSGVRGLWKKGLERLKDCLRVTLSKNLKSVACTFWAGLFTPFVSYINLSLHLCAFLIEFGDLPSLFFFLIFYSPLVDFIFFSLLPNFMHVLFALLFPLVSGGSYSGFLFCFCFFFRCF